MKIAYPITLRAAVMLPFTGLLLAIFIVLAVVQKNSNEKTLLHISEQLLTVNVKNIRSNLDIFLKQPFAATKVLADSIERHQLYHPPKLIVIEDYFRDALNKIYAPLEQIGAIAFGSEDGYLVGFQKANDKNLSLVLKDERTQDKLHIYDGSSSSTAVKYSADIYTPQTRPWYQPFAQSKQAGWSSVYANMDADQTLTISSAAPVFQQGNFLGVVVADINLSRISNFLKKESQNNLGTAYITDANGQLIANSRGLAIIDADNNRILAKDSGNPLIAMNETLFYNNLPTQDNVSSFFQFEHNGTHYFTRISAYYSNNLQWYIVVTLPENALIDNLATRQNTGLFVAFLISIFGLSIGLYVITRITKPIQEIANVSQHLNENNWEVVVKSDVQLYETNQLINAFTSMSSRLQASFSSLRKRISHDALTNLLTRQGLIEHICKQNKTKQGTLILIGLKSFRHTTNSLGHQNAEKLIITIAERLESKLASPIILSRIENDEFAIFKPSVSTHDDAMLFAQQLLDFFEHPFVVDDMKVLVMANAGVVCGQLECNEIATWLRNASLALSHAAVQEDKPICHYQDYMINASQQQTSLTSELKTALNTDEFEVFYQTVIDLTTDEIAGAEALIRWRSPTRGLVSPLDFIPLAEDTGMIIDIGKQILRQACYDTQAQIAKGLWPASFSIHVNLSVRELLQADYVSNVQAILEETGLPAANLALEITESRIISQPHLTNAKLQELRNLGIKIAIDDFGTGYSSLSYIIKLPFDCIKIDRSFIVEMIENDKYTNMIAAIISMANSYGATIVAEGIENEEQAQKLKQLGCRYAQGFYYAKPKPLPEW